MYSIGRVPWEPWLLFRHALLQLNHTQWAEKWGWGGFVDQREMEGADAALVDGMCWGGLNGMVLLFCAVAEWNGVHPGGMD